MAQIDGIGGVFIYSNNPEKLAEWYKTNFKIDLKPLEDGTYYIELYFKSLSTNKKLNTVFAIMKESEPIDSIRNQVMINYRVNNLEEFIKELQEKGISTDPIHIGEDGEGMGKFTHLKDPEGNKIELWEPSNGV